MSKQIQANLSTQNLLLNVWKETDSTFLGKLVTGLPNPFYSINILLLLTNKNLKLQIGTPKFYHLELVYPRRSFLGGTLHKIHRIFYPRSFS